MRVEHLRSLYGLLGEPRLANFTLSDLDDDVVYQFGAFALADRDGRVVLIRRKPIPKYPGIENYWWIPGGGREADEPLDETAMREVEEETGLRISVHSILLAQRVEDRPFIAVFFRGCVVSGSVSSEADPDGITAKARLFPRASITLSQIWMDTDKILLVQEGFATGEVEDLVRKNGFAAR